MGGGFELALELGRHEMIVAAEIKLARPLTERERAGVEQISSLLRVESYCRAFASPAYTPAEVFADLEFLTKQPKQK